MGRNNNTQDTLKDFIGDIADSTKKAFDDILDRRGDDYRAADWISAAYPYQALDALPAKRARETSRRSRRSAARRIPGRRWLTSPPPIRSPL